VIVNKSSVPVGTADSVSAVIADELGKRSVKSLKFSAVSNLGFLKKGAAIAVFNNLDRMVFGADDERAVKILRYMYAPCPRTHYRVMVFNVKCPKFITYVTNAIPVPRTSFANELATFAAKLIAEIRQVCGGIVSGQCIGCHFLYSGCGSCFPNDVHALKKTAIALGMLLKIFQTVEDVNHVQKPVLFKKITGRFGGDLIDKIFAIRTLALKPNTDDMREATSSVVLKGLWGCGTSAPVYYPVATQEIQRICGDRQDLRYAQCTNAALNGADALLVPTNWKTFKSPDLDQIRIHRKGTIVFVGRNLFEPAGMLAVGMELFSISRGSLTER